MRRARRTAAQRRADAVNAVLKRQRRKLGIRVAKVPLDDVYCAGVLVSAGCLDEDRTEDRAALAIGVLLLLQKLYRDQLEKEGHTERVGDDSCPFGELISSIQIEE